MVHISLPDDRCHRLVYYLSVEEYVAAHLEDLIPDVPHGQREAFFMWQVEPTVIFGRNQVMEAEVNLAYCKEKNVQFYRRKSGGGCVYADKGNIMLSYITDSTDVAFTFDKYLQRLTLALRQMGLSAERSGRNDVMIFGKKVSGNSFFLMPQSSVVHGTMLFDSDFENMQLAITPSREKIQSKGVSSVRQHVTNICDELPNDSGFRDIEKFKRQLVRSFCPEGEEVRLGSAHIPEIEKIEAGYLDPDFLSGRNHAYSLEKKSRIEGVGEISVSMDLSGDIISKCHLSGDFLELRPGVDEALSARLSGCENRRETVLEALSGFVLEDYIQGLTGERLVEIIYD